MALSGRVVLSFAVIAFQVFCLIDAANWTDFQNRHVLDPSVNPNYRTWNKRDWNDWLRNRIRDFGTKTINSVITSSPDSILATFRNRRHAHPPAGPDFFWSETTFPIYVLKLVRGGYDVFNCGNLFFLARLESQNRPLHFHGYSTHQRAVGLLPPNSFCTRIN